MTIPRTSPHHITAPDDFEVCKRMLGMTEGEQPVLFTHVVISVHDAGDIINITDHVLTTPSYSATLLVIIADSKQRKEIEEQAHEHDYKQIAKESLRLKWVYKPLKPSKFAIIFDPQKQRELSTDRSKDSAQAIVVNQKQVFDELRARLGNKGFRVLLVEDNKTNQMVSSHQTAVSIQHANEAIRSSSNSSRKWKLTWKASSTAYNAQTRYSPNHTTTSLSFS